MSIRDKIKEYIRELVRRELEEASVTGNLDGGAGPPKTPYMFQVCPTQILLLYQQFSL